MNTFAIFLDNGLYALFLLTVALIAWKAVHFWAPSWVGRPGLEIQLGEGESSMSAALDDLERGLTLLAIIASSAPFIGLAGTVIHIMDALLAMGASASDFSVISGPVVTALKATLLGLACAIPAAVAHALFQRKLQLVENAHRRLLRQAGGLAPETAERA